MGQGGVDLAIPGLPPSIRASMLLHGSNEDFVINAYLALQRQWPDEGGFQHYLFLLGQRQSSRADVLREIAASDNARRCGVEFVDDLAPDHQFRPEDHDRTRLTELSLALRVGRLVADLEQFKGAIGQLVPERLTQAVEAVVREQRAHQCLLESRLNALQDRPMAGGDGAGTSVDTGDLPRWQHLAQRQLTVEHGLGELQQAVGSIRADVAELKSAFAQLHAYATQDLKRQVADYVNAMATIQPPIPTTRSPRAVRPLRRLAPAAVTAGDMLVTPVLADHA